MLPATSSVNELVLPVPVFSLMSRSRPSYVQLAVQSLVRQGALASGLASRNESATVLPFR